MRLKPILFVLLALAVFARLGVSQPIAPTADLKSQTTTAPVLDLPYKPEEPADAAPEPEDGAEAPGDTVATPEDLNKPVFDWNNLPYLPLKMPVLKGLPDPDF